MPGTNDARPLPQLLNVSLIPQGPAKVEARGVDRVRMLIVKEHGDRPAIDVLQAARPSTFQCAIRGLCCTCKAWEAVPAIDLSGMENYKMNAHSNRGAQNVKTTLLIRCLGAAASCSDDTTLSWPELVIGATMWPAGLMECSSWAPETTKPQIECTATAYNSGVQTCTTQNLTDHKLEHSSLQCCQAVSWL